MNWYPRDASWHERPDVKSIKKFHLPGKPRREGISPLCGRKAVINDDMPWDEPPESLKCKKCLTILNKSIVF